MQPFVSVVPKISIITVCYNSEKTIKTTIESVLAQTYTNIEYLIIDGKSTDTTIAIAEDYKSDFEKKGIKFQIISEPDKGIYDAMNKGIMASSGEWIGIINSDDWYSTNSCELIAQISEHNHKLKVIYGICALYDISLEGDIVLAGFHQRSLSRLKNNKEIIAHPATFVKRDVYDEFLYDVVYSLAADLDWFYKVARKYEVDSEMIGAVLAHFRCDGATLKQHFLSQKERVIIEAKYHGYSRFRLYRKLLINYIFNKFIRR